MPSKIHPSFQSVCANRLYRCGDIMQALENRHNQLSEDVQKGVKHDPKELIDYRDACLAVEKMKQEGHETIALNPEQDMAYQILASTRKKISDDTSLYYYCCDAYAGGINP